MACPMIADREKIQWNDMPIKPHLDGPLTLPSIQHMSSHVTLYHDSDTENHSSRNSLTTPQNHYRDENVHHSMPLAAQQIEVDINVCKDDQVAQLLREWTLVDAQSLSGADRLPEAREASGPNPAKRMKFA